MKRGILTAAALLICISLKGQPAPGNSTNNSPLSITQPLSTSVLTQDNRAKITENIEGKKVQVGGPLAHPFQARRLADVPKRIGQLFNPFAKVEAPRQIQRDKGISTRSWTEVAGWNPGRSAFPDPTTHEPTMKLIVVTRPEEH